MSYRSVYVNSLERKQKNNSEVLVFDGITFVNAEPIRHRRYDIVVLL
jgi:hypothetical protein